MYVKNHCKKITIKLGRNKDLSNCLNIFLLSPVYEKVDLSWKSQVGREENTLIGLLEVRNAKNKVKEQGNLRGNPHFLK